MTLTALLIKRKMLGITQTLGRRNPFKCEQRDPDKPAQREKRMLGVTVPIDRQRQ